MVCKFLLSSFFSLCVGLCILFIEVFEECLVKLVTLVEERSDELDGEVFIDIEFNGCGKEIEGVNK